VWLRHAHVSWAIFIGSSCKPANRRDRPRDDCYHMWPLGSSLSTCLAVKQTQMPQPSRMHLLRPSQSGAHGAVFKARHAELCEGQTRGRDGPKGSPDEVLSGLGDREGDHEDDDEDVQGQRQAADRCHQRICASQS